MLCSAAGEYRLEEVREDDERERGPEDHELLEGTESRRVSAPFASSTTQGHPSSVERSQCRRTASVTLGDRRAPKQLRVDRHDDGTQRHEHGADRWRQHDSPWGQYARR